MSSHDLFHRDPYLTEIDTEVISVDASGDAFRVVLGETILFPEGGGQPADHGWLGDVPVTEVQRSGDTILHTVPRAVPLGRCRLQLDWDRRFDHMQHHTAQHLLTALAQDRHGWATTAFHLGADLCDIEVDRPTVDRDELDALEEQVAAEIRAARTVSDRLVPPARLESLSVRTRGLPEGHRGDVRLVEIAGIDLNTCGGTHVRSTAEIEAVKLLHTEPMRGGTRISFVAGRRLRRRLAAHEDRNSLLRRTLEAADVELVNVARQRSERLRDLERTLRQTEEELAGALAGRLAAMPGTITDAAFENRAMPFLLAVARRVTEDAPEKIVFLTASSADGGLFALAAGSAVGVDVASLGRTVASRLGGRGGGSGRTFQGKAPSLAGRADALAAIIGADPSFSPGSTSGA